MTEVPKAALDWLFGEGPDADGKWFGECEDAVTPLAGKYPRKYWWRSRFRAMIEGAPPQPRYFSGCLRDGVCRGVCRNADCPNYDLVVAARLIVEPQESGILYPRRCQKCGSTTKGEEAYVDGQFWCHPCADEVAHTSTDNS